MKRYEPVLPKAHVFRTFAHSCQKQSKQTVFYKFRNICPYKLKALKETCLAKLAHTCYKKSKRTVLNDFVNNRTIKKHRFHNLQSLLLKLQGKIGYFPNLSHICNNSNFGLEGKTNKQTVFIKWSNMHQFYQKHFLVSKRFVTVAKSNQNRLFSSRLVTFFPTGCFHQIESHLQNLAERDGSHSCWRKSKQTVFNRSGNICTLNAKKHCLHWVKPHLPKLATKRKPTFIKLSHSCQKKTRQG